MEIRDIIFLRRYPRLQRLARFIVSAAMIYFVFKAPVMWFLTDVFGLHYVLSGFVAGSVITLLNFVPSEFWIWKKKS